jgi:hypothetical protein
VKYLALGLLALGLPTSAQEAGNRLSLTCVGGGIQEDLRPVAAMIDLQFGRQARAQMAEPPVGMFVVLPRTAPEPDRIQLAPHHCCLPHVGLPKKATQGCKVNGMTMQRITQEALKRGRDRIA